MMEALIADNHGAHAIDHDRIARLVDFIASKLSLPEPSEVSISFVSNDVMADLNARFRHREGPTDVLSFECDNLDDSFPGYQTLFEAGDIIIAGDVAATQAKEAGHSTHDEIDMLITHGILHLIGYDHIEEEDALEMERLQDGLLEQWRAEG